MRKLSILLIGVMALVTTAGTAGAADQPLRVVTAHGTFGPYRPGVVATTYQPHLVPRGASADVFSTSSPGPGTRTVLTVRGLVPNRGYGAHVHTKRCGASGDAAGPHFQFRPDPVQPSTDPKYANPRNEIWLDFTTNARGNAVGTSRVTWQFGNRHAYSVVIHETHTHTGPGHAGTAGARLACINVAF
jgi:superoxide dismutase, Cu-Zn family